MREDDKEDEYALLKAGYFDRVLFVFRIMFPLLKIVEVDQNLLQSGNPYSGH
jgi:hypothetical protein